MYGTHTGNKDTERKDNGGDFRSRTHKGGNRGRRTIVHIGYPHMEWNRTQFKCNGDYDKYHTQFQQPFIGLLIESRSQDGSKIKGTGGAVNHRNTIEQQTGGQRAQYEVFQRGLGRAAGVAAQGNHGVQRQRQQFQTDIRSQEMCRADHDAHTQQGKQ